MVLNKPNIKYLDPFLSLSCTPHIALTMNLSVLHKIPISFSDTMLHFNTVFQALHNSNKQPLSALKEISCHTANITFPTRNPLTCCSDSHSSLTSSTCTYPVTKKCEFLYCIHFTTLLFFRLHCLSNSSLHIFSMYNIFKSLESPFSLQHIYRGCTYHTVHTILR